MQSPWYLGSNDATIRLYDNLICHLKETKDSLSGKRHAALLAVITTQSYKASGFTKTGKRYKWAGSCTKE